MIELLDVDFSFGSKSVFQGLNLRINKGGTTVVLGDNGSGKTTLSNIIAGLYPVNNGSILVDGKDITYWRENKIPKVGILFQNPDNQFIRYKVQDEIKISFEYVKKERKLFKTVTDVLDFFQLHSIKHSLINNLSGGEKQKLALACILTCEPEYLILDEPFAHLDPQNEHIIRKVLSELKDNVTIIEISQKISDYVFDNYVYLDSGRIVFYGDYPEFVKSGYTNSEGKSFLDKLRKVGIDIPDRMVSNDEIIKFIRKNYAKDS